MKLCTKCRKQKLLDCFDKHGSGLHSHCKSCRRTYQSAWYQMNRERELAKHKEWYRQRYLARRRAKESSDV